MNYMDIGDQMTLGSNWRDKANTVFNEVYFLNFNIV